MSKKNLRRVSYVISAQTAWHIKDLARLGNTTPGHILDKLVREKMLSLRVERYPQQNVRKGGNP